MEEALRLHAASARAAYDAKYSTEEQSAMARMAKEAAGKKLIASGKAATLEEAYTLLGRRGAEAMAQKLVDRGEVSTLKEAYALSGRRAQQIQLEKYGWESLQRMSSDAGVKVAEMRGHRTKYPGVRWQKKQDRKTHKPLDDGPVDPETTRGFWRVCFRYKGKFYNVGSGYATEEVAARAHDTFVRANGMSRRLHFPKECDVPNVTDSASSVHRLRGGSVPYRKYALSPTACKKKVHLLRGGNTKGSLAASGEHLVKFGGGLAFLVGSFMLDANPKAKLQGAVAVFVGTPMLVTGLCIKLYTQKRVGDYDVPLFLLLFFILVTYAPLAVRLCIHTLAA